MRSISDILRELGCGRNTIYPVIEAAGVEPTLEGLAKMFTDEDFQKIQEVYYQKYPNRKPKEPRNAKQFSEIKFRLEKLELHLHQFVRTEMRHTDQLEQLDLQLSKIESQLKSIDKFVNYNYAVIMDDLLPLIDNIKRKI